MAKVKDIKGAFGATKSESRYLNDRIDVQDARRKILDASTELTIARRQFDRVNSTDPSYQRYADAIKAAQNKVEQAKVEADKITASAQVDYKRLLRKVEKKTSKKEAVTIDERLSVEENVLKRLQDSGQSTVAQEAKIQDLIDKKNKTGKYAPKTPEGQTPEGAAAPGTRDIANDILDAGRSLYERGDKARLQLAKDLKAAGYNVPITGVYNETLLIAYQTALQDNLTRNTDTKREFSWGEFLFEKEKEAKALEAAKGPGRPTPGTVSISTATEAAGIIERAFQSELKRPPTPKELAAFTNDLIKEEKKFSSVTRPVKRVVNGVEYVEYVGGIDRNQFLTDKIRKLPEFNNRKQAARTLTVDDLAKTARSNGLDLNKDFGDSVNNWVKRVENGEDVDIFKNLIRGTAKLGMPQNVQSLMDNGLDLEAIYAPYKRVMASTLEVTPDSISLNDPTLRTAVGPEKEMSIYDFEKNLRRDNRWQYTNKAREEVADATLKVLRDFGFTG